MAAPRKDFCIRGHDLNDPKNIRIRKKKVYSLKRGWYFIEARDCRKCLYIHKVASARRRRERERGKRSTES